MKMHSDSSNSDDGSDVNSLETVVERGGRRTDIICGFVTSSTCFRRFRPCVFLQSKVTAAKNLASDDEDDDEANNDKAVSTGTAGRRFVE
jgi:hypothetical protein